MVLGFFQALELRPSGLHQTHFTDSHMEALFVTKWGVLQTSEVEQTSAAHLSKSSHTTNLRRWRTTNWPLSELKHTLSWTGLTKTNRDHTLTTTQRQTLRIKKKIQRSY